MNLCRARGVLQKHLSARCRLFANLALGQRGHGDVRSSLSRTVRIARETRRGLHNAHSPGDVIEAFKTTLSFPRATHRIQQLQDASVPEHSEVTLHGYLGSQTVLSRKLCFAPLFSQDLDYSVQIVSATNRANEGKINAHAALLRLPAHTPVVVTGSLQPRKAPTTESLGDKSKITAREVHLHSIQALNTFPDDIIMTPETIFPPEQRHLQLRQERGLRDALRLRSKVAKFCRDILNHEGFTEVETPVLFKPTPEGAHEFIVPTRRPGLVYALPQSPQQYKQILVASGISRYYQIARCFRDEDLRTDRQPEFTQLDLEMSFATGEDVMQIMEQVISKLWGDLLGQKLPAPFPRLTYTEAMTRYGSDKPDTTFEAEISRLDYVLPVDLISKISSLNFPIVEGLILRLSKATENSSAATRRFITDFLDSTEGAEFNNNPHGAPGIFVYDSSKPIQGLQALGFEAVEEIERIFEPENGDLLVLQARSQTDLRGGSTALGNLRLSLHRSAKKLGFLSRAQGFSPLWVTDFPLFSPASDTEPGQGGSAGLAATHHPFTSPKTPTDVDLLSSEPSKAIADHYDLVINGVELGGGSRRIHDAAMQRYIMESVLQMEPARIAEFEHLLEALRAGCPPHAGMALGFDRLIALMAGRESIRDVIAFPKSNRGEDLLARSPSKISKETQDRYHLKMQ